MTFFKYMCGVKSSHFSILIGALWHVDVLCGAGRGGAGRGVGWCGVVWWCGAGRGGVGGAGCVCEDEDETVMNDSARKRCAYRCICFPSHTDTFPLHSQVPVCAAELMKRLHQRRGVLNR
jgi:hypothetical protein